jgi:hypothetical protein
LWRLRQRSTADIAAISDITTASRPNPPVRMTTRFLYRDDSRRPVKGNNRASDARAGGARCGESIEGPRV